MFGREYFILLEEIDNEEDLSNETKNRLNISISKINKHNNNNEEHHLNNIEDREWKCQGL